MDEFVKALYLSWAVGCLEFYNQGGSKLAYRYRDYIWYKSRFALTDKQWDKCARLKWNGDK